MSGGMEDFIPRAGARDSGPQGPWEALITTGAVSVTDDVFAAPVGSDLEDGPCRWSPRVGKNDDGDPIVRYPQEGDTALVTEDDNGNYWILEWTPYG